MFLCLSAAATSISRMKRRIALSLTANSGKQRLDRNCASGALLAPEHHATHAAAAQQLHGVVTGNRLRRTLELDATVFTKKRQMLIRRRCLRLFAPAAVNTFDHHEHRPRRHACILSRLGKIDSTRRDFNDQNRFTTLNPIAVIQKCISARDDR